MKLISDGFLKSTPKFAELDKTGAYAQVKAHAYDTNHGGDSPYQIVYNLIDVCDCLQHLMNSSVFRSYFSIKKL